MIGTAGLCTKKAGLRFLKPEELRDLTHGRTQVMAENAEEPGFAFIGQGQLYIQPVQFLVAIVERLVEPGFIAVDQVQ